MTLELARSLWHYSPKTGELRWLKSIPNCPEGTRAGTINSYGYWILTWKGKKYRASRLAFLIMLGRWPKPEVDHINGKRSDDRWSNLREATRSQQLGNASIRSNNKLKIKGVCRSKKDGKFYAYICRDGKRKNLGGYATAMEAKSAYDSAACSTEWHGVFARL